jgi:hypothetical protein
MVDGCTAEEDSIVVLSYSLFSKSMLDHILYHRMATTMCKWIIQDFQSQLYKTCGVHSLVLTAYEGEDHDLKVSM